MSVFPKLLVAYAVGITVAICALWSIVADQKVKLATPPVCEKVPVRVITRASKHCVAPRPAPVLPR